MEHWCHHCSSVGAVLLKHIKSQNYLWNFIEKSTDQKKITHDHTWSTDSKTVVLIERIWDIIKRVNLLQTITCFFFQVAETSFPAFLKHSVMAAVELILPLEIIQSPDVHSRSHWNETARRLLCGQHVEADMLMWKAWSVLGCGGGANLPGILLFGRSSDSLKDVSSLERT